MTLRYATHQYSVLCDLLSVNTHSPHIQITDHGQLVTLEATEGSI